MSGPIWRWRLHAENSAWYRPHDSTFECSKNGGLPRAAQSRYCARRPLPPTRPSRRGRGYSSRTPARSGRLASKNTSGFSTVRAPWPEWPDSAADNNRYIAWRLSRLRVSLSSHAFGVFSTGLSMVSINSTGTFNAFSLSSTPVWLSEGLERSWAIIRSGRLAITLPG